MTSVVIPLGNGSIWYNHEIRFCLRSVERYLKGVGKVWIIGRLPDFLQNVEFRPYVEKDNERVPDRNIAGKLLAACQMPEISDPFLYMNDDHYLLSEFEASKFPNYHNSTLTEFLKKRMLDPYGKRISNSLKWLNDHNLPDNFYDIHFPMLIHKGPFTKSVGQLEWAKSYDGWIIKSIYGNYAGVEPTEQKDCKSIDPPGPNAIAFSSLPRVKASVQRFLLERFPDVSRYEKEGFK